MLGINGLIGWLVFNWYVVKAIYDSLDVLQGGCKALIKNKAELITQTSALSMLIFPLILMMHVINVVPRKNKKMIKVKRVLEYKI